MEIKDILFMPYLDKYKAPLGALYSLEEVCFNIYINASFDISELFIVFYVEDEYVFKKELTFKKNHGFYNEYSVRTYIDEPKIYWYHFEFMDCYGKHYICSNEALEPVLQDYISLKYQLSVKRNKTNKFNWYKGKVMYQILVDRFFQGGNNPIKKDSYIHPSWDDPVIFGPINNNYNIDFYRGDLRGVIEKLPYLKKLNVGIIYFNPIFDSPSSHKYNTSDYLKLDEMYGTIDDFKELIEKAKKLDIEIILDGVFNHTGDDSIYFNKYNHFDEIGAFQSKDSKYFNWFRFIEHPNKYHSWWGIDTLPSVNQESGYVDFITKDVIPYWMKYNIKGFRLDVVDELNTRFVQKINKSIKKSDEDAIVIGEVWEDATNKISYSVRRSYFNEDELDSVMNYVIKDAIIMYLKDNKLEQLVYKLRYQINNYHHDNMHLLMNILSTHDTVRILSIFSNINSYSLSNKEKQYYKMQGSDYYNARSKLLMAYVILYTIPGVPCIYYGDEVGLEGYKDPFCRRSFPWNNIDNTILEYLFKLGEIRKEDVFTDGTYLEESFYNNVFIYRRIKNDVTILVIVNNSNSEFNYNINSCYDLIDEIRLESVITVFPQTAKILKIVN